MFFARKKGCIRKCQNAECKASETREIAKLFTEIKVQSGKSLSWKYFYGETPAAKDIVLTSTGTNKVVAIIGLPENIDRFILEIYETDPMVIHVKPQTFLWAATFKENLERVKVRYEDGTEGWWSPAEGSVISTLKAEVVPALETYSVKVTGGIACYPTDRTHPITSAHPGEWVCVIADYDNIPKCREFDYWAEKHGIVLDSEENMQEPAPEFTMPAADLELDAVTKFVSHVGPEEVRDAKDATCTVDGNTGNTVCAECGDILKVGTAIPAKGHQFGPWIHTGSHTHSCTVCGFSETEACEFGDWTVTKAATADKAGEKQRICKKCSYVDTAETKPGTPGKPGDVVKSDEPKTGDSRSLVLWTDVLLFAAASLAISFTYRRRKET